MSALEDFIRNMDTPNRGLVVMTDATKLNIIRRLLAAANSQAAPLPVVTADGERFIDIVFDGPPSHESGRFIEVENSSGASIKFGNWLKRPDGYWALRIAARIGDEADVQEELSPWATTLLLAEKHGSWVDQYGWVFTDDMLHDLVNDAIRAQQPEQGEGE